MHRFSALFLMIAVTAGATVVHSAATTSPAAARFWEQALPGTPMPRDIQELVRKGNNHSPNFVVERHYPALPDISVCGAWTGMCTASMAAATGIFFHQAQLRPGSTMTLSFPPAEADEPPFLLSDVAEQVVPFANLTAVLTAFGIPAGSAEAHHVAATLSLCQSPPHPGEVRACAASLESTVRNAIDMLVGGATANNQSVWVATSVLPAGGGLPRGLYEVQAVTALEGDHFVGCHKVPFPYRVYQCHMTAGTSDKAYLVSLRGLGGGPNAEMLAFCHLDTAKWNPAHPAFEVLHTHPATPVCHFIPYANPVFGKKATKP